MVNIREGRADLKPNRRASNLTTNTERELTVTAVSFSTPAGRAFYLETVPTRKALRDLRQSNYAVRFGTRQPFVLTARTLTELVGIIEVIVGAFWSMRAYIGFWWRHAGMTHEEFRAWDRENRAMVLRIWPGCGA